MQQYRSDRLVVADLRFVVERLSDFYTPQEIRIWLHAPHPLLNEQRPIHLIRADHTHDVLAVIDRLGAGAFL